MKVNSKNFIFILTIFIFISLFSCSPKAKIEGLSIVLKDTVNLYKSQNNTDQADLVLQYGSVVQRVASENNETKGDFIKVIPLNNKKVYYVNSNDLYPVKKTVKIKDKTYYVLKQGMIDIMKGSYFYNEVTLDAEGKLTPKGGNAISWGTQLNILFEKTKEISPGAIFLEPTNYKVREGKFLLVQFEDNANLMGYVYASTTAFDAQAAVVATKSQYFSAPINSAVSLGTLDPFELVTIVEENNGYFKFNCSNKKIYGKYILFDNVSKNFNDVNFVQKLQAKLPAGISSIQTIVDQNLINEIIAMIKEYLDKNSETGIREPLNEILRSIEPQTDDSSDYEEETD